MKIGDSQENGNFNRVNASGSFFSNPAENRPELPRMASLKNVLPCTFFSFEFLFGTTDFLSVQRCFVHRLQKICGILFVRFNTPTLASGLLIQNFAQKGNYFSENAFPSKIGTIIEETIISKMTGAKYSALTIPTASPF